MIPQSSVDGSEALVIRARTRMRQKSSQGAKFKEALTLGLMQVQDQHLRMSPSLNFVPRSPGLPHSSPNPVDGTRGERTSLKEGRKLAFSLSTLHTEKGQNYCVGAS